MEGRPERIADYFVVVGLGKNVTQFQQLPVEEVDISQSSIEPITDLVVMFRRHEDIPKGYRCIEMTPSGHSANLNAGSPFTGSIHLCYRQGRDKAPLTEISVFYMNQEQQPPADHETIAFSVGGRSADLNRGGQPLTFLTVRRGMLFGHNTAITGLCLIMPSKGEEPPPGYKLLRRDLNREGLVSHALLLCYKTSLIHPRAFPYTPELISRYPQLDYPEFPLPESVPLFCLPFGVSVEHWDRHAPFPLPTFSSFALTNAQGQCMYGSVVVFYEQMPEADCRPEMREALKVAEGEVLHMNKCVCVLSHWPFFSTFKAFLSALYRLSISRNITLPLERYISNLMLDVPFPTMERPRVQMSIGAEHIVFSLPVRTPLPLSVSTHWSLLHCLDEDHCVALLSLLLLEQRIVLHSSRPALLTCVGEALRSVLFPFSWQCTYIPMCPLAFSSYMQAPVPFIIGIDSQYFEVYERPSEVCVVDLDANSILLSRDARHSLEHRPLPSKPVRILKQSLKHLAAKVADMNPGCDFAVEVAPLEYQGTSNRETVDVEIREAFLRFHATIIGHYRQCLRPLLSAPSERSWDPALLFDQQLFLKHCPVAEWPFFTHFFDTQIFNAFIEQRSFAHAESTALAFFDECAEKLLHDPTAQLLNVGADVSRRSDLPTVVALPPDNTGLDKGKTYSYSTFPVLDPSLFLSPHSPLAHNSSMRHILPGSPMVARRTQAEKTKDRMLLEKAQRNDSLWPKCLLSHVCSLWYIHLPSHITTTWNKMGVLSQALELLEDMRKKQALPSDEVCYRILMEQCVKMGRPALAVRVYHAMIKAGIQPNAVTYGFYNKAVIEGSWPSKKRNWKILLIAILACLHLQRRLKRKHRLEQSDEMGEPNFSSLTRSSSMSSRKSISALDVGVDEDLAEEAHEHPLTKKISSASKRKSSIYKLSTNLLPGMGESGDYVVRGDSSYMAEKSPRWGESGVEERQPSVSRGLWSSMRLTDTSGSTKLRRLSRVVDTSELGIPKLNVEITSCTQCSSCKRLIYDEQIMASWSDNDADYKTSCPYCHTKLVASLTIVIKQTLPYKEGSSKERGKQQDAVIPEEDEPLSPTSPIVRSQTWDRKSVQKLTKSKTVDPSSSRSKSPRLVTSEATSTENSQVSGQREGSPESTDGGISSLPAEFFTPPRTDPLHRKIKSFGHGIGGTPSSFIRDELSSSSKTATGRGESSGKTSDSVSVSRSLTAPSKEVGLNLNSEKVASGSSNEAEPQANTTTEVVVTNPKEGGGSDPPSSTTAGSQSDSKGERREETDLGVSSYIAQLRARGHKRSSSAPVHYQPPPIPMVVESPIQGDRGAAAKEKPRFHTESSPPLVVPYLSPVVLRKEVETLISQNGTKCLEREELVRDRPIIYWNLVWYFSRLQLPTYLPLLTLWGFTHSNQELQTQYVQMKVDLLWDGRFRGVREPLYLMWLGKVPRALQIPPNPGLTRRDSEFQLQSLVARTQCGDLLPVLQSLLEDRRRGSSELASRSLYRETLFLKCVLTEGNMDIDQFEREYTQHMQRLPRELSSLMRQEDHLPSHRALQCRRDFGCLQIS